MTVGMPERDSPYITTYPPLNYSLLGHIILFLLLLFPNFFCHKLATISAQAIW